MIEISGRDPSTGEHAILSVHEDDDRVAVHWAGRNYQSNLWGLASAAVTIVDAGHGGEQRLDIRTDRGAIALTVVGQQHELARLAAATGGTPAAQPPALDDDMTTGGGTQLPIAQQPAAPPTAQPPPAEQVGSLVIPPHQPQTPGAPDTPYVALPVVVQQQPGTNGLAIASFVLSLIWIYWIGSIIGLVFGYVALSQIKRRGGSGKGFAIAGIVLGWVGVGILLIFLILMAIAASSAN